MYTYEDILRFATTQHLTSRPFSEVLQLYEQEVDEIVKDAYADQQIDYNKSYSYD